MTSTMTLLERVEGATGPDRELDAEIAFALKYPQLRPGGLNDRHGHDEPCMPGDLVSARHGDRLGYTIAEYYTASLDAVLALVEEKLPGRAADMLSESIDIMQFTGWRPNKPITPQLCRALLRHLLTALEAGDG